MSEIESYSDKELIEKIAQGLDILGFQTEVYDTEETPVSIGAPLVGYEAEQVSLTILFLPMEDVLGEEVQILQMYISLFDQEIPEEQYVEMERMCNFCNMNTPVGTFGVQEHLGRVCLKTGITVRKEQSFDIPLGATLDTVIMMALALDGVYDMIAKIMYEGATFEEAFQVEDETNEES